MSNQTILHISYSLTLDEKTAKYASSLQIAITAIAKIATNLRKRLYECANKNTFTKYVTIKEPIFIAENGSLVRFHGEDLYEATMPRDFYLSTFEKLKTSPYFDEKKMLLTGKEACYVLDTVDETYLMFSHHYNENIKKVASLEDITDEIFKFTTNFTEETVEAGEAWVNEHVPGVKAMTTGFESIDIVLDHVDKGVAIVELAKKLNLDMDQVMAFGDNLNDLHMMQVVGHPVAPENARPEILELAETVIGHHKDQSVITYMEEL